MSPDDWSPTQYERFKAEREAPFFDLLEMVQPAPDLRVVDLGCGTGELTRHLHRHLPAATTLGVDRSESMLARSAAFAEQGLRFERRDLVAALDDGPFDLIFSNAALQWLDDHAALLARLAVALAPGGQLAVQVPANHDHVTHLVAHAVAAEPPFVAALDGYRRESPLLAPERYAALLHELGFTAQRVELRVYPHLLASAGEMVEWVKGTLLTAYLGRLPAELREPFVERYRDVLLQKVEVVDPYFYPFKRILFWAR